MTVPCKKADFGSLKNIYMADKHIYTVDKSESKDGHTYTEGEYVDPFVSIIYVHKDGKVHKQFSTRQAADEYIRSKKKSN